MFKIFMSFYNQIHKAFHQDTSLESKWSFFPEFKIKLDNKFTLSDIIYNELFLYITSLVKKNAAELFSYIEELLPAHILKQ